jgi:hypothetical protein
VVLMLFCLVAAALGASAEQVEARLEEVAPMREMRLAGQLPPASSADVKKAVQGQIIVNVSGNFAQATAVLNVPIGQLWAGINDETRHPGYTAVAYAELMSGGACQSGRATLLYLPIPVPMVDDRWWINHIYANDKIARESGNSVREMVFRGSTDPAEVVTESGKKIIQKAEPIASTYGGWFVVAIDQFSTYIEYHSVTDPGSGIPSSVTSRLAAQGVRDQILAVQKFAKEGNPVCPVY